MQFISGHLGAVASLIDLSFTTRSGTAANSATYNSTGVPVGAAHANRRVIRAYGFHSTVSTRTISSITLDGVTGTVVGALQKHTSGGITVYAAIYRFNIPTGTSPVSGQIVLSGSVDGLVTASFRMVNSTATPTDTAFDTGADPSDTIDIAAGGGAIAFLVQITPTPDMTWAGLTFNDQGTYDGPDDARQSSASDVFVASQTGMTVSVATTDTTAAVMVAASWPV